MTLACDSTEAAIISAILQKWEEPILPINPQLERDGMRFILSEKIPVVFSEDDGLYSCSSDELGIYAVGTTKDSAAESFIEDFVALYKHLAEETDDLLTEEAKRVKRAFKALILRVTKDTVARA